MKCKQKIKKERHIFLSLACYCSLKSCLTGTTKHTLTLTPFVHKKENQKKKKKTDYYSKKKK